MSDEAPTTVRQVVKALGGHRATADMFDVSIPAVSNWVAADAFPARLHLKIHAECKQRGIRYSPDPSIEAA